jgi:hypothetical protein
LVLGLVVAEEVVVVLYADGAVELSTDLIVAGELHVAVRRLAWNVIFHFLAVDDELVVVVAALVIYSNELRVAIVDGEVDAEVVIRSWSLFETQEGATYLWVELRICGAAFLWTVGYVVAGKAGGTGLLGT